MDTNNLQREALRRAMVQFYYTDLYFFCSSRKQVGSSKECKLSSRTRSSPGAGNFLSARIVDLRMTAWSKKRRASPSPSASSTETFSNSTRKLSKLSSQTLPTSNMVTACFFKPWNISFLEISLFYIKKSTKTYR